MKVIIEKTGSGFGPISYDFDEANLRYLLDHIKVEGGGPYRDIREYPEAEAILFLRCLDTTASVELFNLYRERQRQVNR